MTTLGPSVTGRGTLTGLRGHARYESVLMNLSAELCSLLRQETGGLKTGGFLLQKTAAGAARGANAV
jgi:hypothetical protein